MVSPSPAASPATGQRRFDPVAVGAFCLVALIWGSTWLVIRHQVSAASPSWTVAVRFVLAAMGMALLALLRGESLRLPPRALVLAAGIGLVQFCANFQFVYRAEQHVTSGLVAVIYALLMVPNAVLARLFLGERANGRFIAGSGVAIAGIFVLMWQETGMAPQGSVLAGAAFSIAGLLSASIANVAQTGPTGRAHPVVPLIAWAMVFGALFDVALALSIDGAPAWRMWGGGFWLGVAYLALIGSVVAFPVYFALIRRIGAARAAYGNAAVPVVAMALSTLFEGYRWTGVSALGAVLAMAGLVLALSGRALSA
ncbi:MAG TPA: EamA family transporter, partial [Novosphingobium sp.]|nr:EamA family transporter [Novosphingobium sp.]